MAWIGNKGTNELDEISTEKCYELPSKNSSYSTWHTATLATQHIVHVCLSIYLSIYLLS